MCNVSKTAKSTAKNKTASYLNYGAVYCWIYCNVPILIPCYKSQQQMDYRLHTQG